MKSAQGEILFKEGMEINRRIERDAEALSEEGTSLDQATEEEKSLDNAKVKMLNREKRIRKAFSRGRFNTNLSPSIKFSCI